MKKNLMVTIVLMLASNVVGVSATEVSSEVEGITTEEVSTVESIMTEEPVVEDTTEVSTVLEVLPEAIETTEQEVTEATTEAEKKPLVLSDTQKMQLRKIAARWINRDGSITVGEDGSVLIDSDKSYFVESMNVLDDVYDLIISDGINSFGVKLVSKEDGVMLNGVKYVLDYMGNVTHYVPDAELGTAPHAHAMIEQDFLDSKGNKLSIGEFEFSINDKVFPIEVADAKINEGGIVEFLLVTTDNAKLGLQYNLEKGVLKVLETPIEFEAASEFVNKEVVADYFEAQTETTQESTQETTRDETTKSETTVSETTVFETTQEETTKSVLTTQSVSTTQETAMMTTIDPNKGNVVTTNVPGVIFNPITTQTTAVPVLPNRIAGGKELPGQNVNLPSAGEVASNAFIGGGIVGLGSLLELLRRKRK